MWDLAPSNAEDAEEYASNVRRAIEASWPKLKAALTAAFGADVTKNGRNVPCTLETYARLCGATQMNALAVKVPHPLMKYVVSTVAAEGALTEHVQWLMREKADRVAKKASEEEKVLDGAMDIDDIDLDSDSDDDETREANGDERYSFGGDTAKTRASISTPPSFPRLRARRSSRSRRRSITAAIPTARWPTSTTAACTSSPSGASAATRSAP